MNEHKNNKNHQAIMACAKSLFWKHGVRRITVEEICLEAGVSKMTFYRFFKNKTLLAEVVLGRVLNENFGKYRHIMQQPITFAERMKQVILLKQDATTDISEEFIRDIYQQGNPLLLQMINEFRGRMMNELMMDFRDAQRNGWIRKDIKLDLIPYMMDHLTAIIMDKNFLDMYKDSHEAIMEITNFFFHGILSDEAPSK